MVIAPFGLEIFPTVPGFIEEDDAAAAAFVDFLRELVVDF
jgi:hypothetical protein